MIESLFSGLVRLLAWLWGSAMTLYYLAGFFIVIGGFVIFAGSVAHHYWKRSLEDRTVYLPPPPPTSVRIENLNVTVELTESQLLNLLAWGDVRALPPPERDEE